MATKDKFIHGICEKTGLVKHWPKKSYFTKEGNVYEKRRPTVIVGQEDPSVLTEQASAMLEQISQNGKGHKQVADQELIAAAETAVPETAVTGEVMAETQPTIEVPVSQALEENNACNEIPPTAPRGKEMNNLQSPTPAEIAYHDAARRIQEAMDAIKRATEQLQEVTRLAEQSAAAVVAERAGAPVAEQAAEQVVAAAVEETAAKATEAVNKATKTIEATAPKVSTASEKRTAEQPASAKPAASAVTKAKPMSRLKYCLLYITVLVMLAIVASCIAYGAAFAYGYLGTLGLSEGVTLLAQITTALASFGAILTTTVYAERKLGKLTTARILTKFEENLSKEEAKAFA